MIDTHTSITDINLSVRTLTLLMRDGINTVGDYLAKRDELAALGDFLRDKECSRI